jgi:hypothetical protein
LRQQLLVLRRRPRRPYLKTADRFFWVLASGWLGGWRNLLLVVEPQTVLKWHQRDWRLYWSWRSRMRPRTGRPAIPQQLQVLIRRMAAENQLWGQKRIQAELASLGFKVSARTVAKYMRTARHDRGPSVRWQTFLKLHPEDGLQLALKRKALAGQWSDADDDDCSRLHNWRSLDGEWIRSTRTSSRGTRFVRTSPSVRQRRANLLNAEAV